MLELVSDISPIFDQCTLMSVEMYWFAFFLLFRCKQSDQILNWFNWCPDQNKWYKFLLNKNIEIRIVDSKSQKLKAFINPYTVLSAKNQGIVGL